MLKAVLSTFSSKVISAVFGFLVLILTTQHLGAEGKGEISLFILNITIITLVAGFVGGPSVVYLVPRLSLASILLSSYLWNILSCLIVPYVIYFFGFTSSDKLFHLILLGLIEAIYSTNLFVVLGKEKIMSFNIITIIQASSLALSFLVILKLDTKLGFSSFLVALYLSKLLVLVISFIPLIKEQFLKSEFGLLKTFKEALKLGFYNQTGRIAQLFNYRLSYFLLGFYSTTAFVGIYATATNIAESVWLVSSSLSLVQYSRISNSTNKKYSNQLTLIMLKISFIVSFFSMIALMICPNSIYQFVFGKEFVNVKNILLFLSPGILAFSLSAIFSNHFSGNGKHKVNSVSSWIGLIITLCLSAFFVNYFGIIGAAICTSISYISSTVYQMFLFRKTENIEIQSFFINKKDIRYLFKMIQFKT